MTAPSIFISYSHDSADHKKWVVQLATDLRNNGVNASLDHWDLALGQDVSLFMQKGISEADRVLLICSDSYVEKADRGSGGVGYERSIVTEEMVASIDTKKFIPLIREGKLERKIPKFLGPRRWIDFNKDASYDESLQDLLRELLDAQGKPPLGPNPFSGETARAAGPARVAGPGGVTSAGQRVLDEKWFHGEQVIASQGIEKLGLSGLMELRFGLHEDLNKSQVELLNAVQKSEIKTFGWPIGITLNPDEYRPKPYADGIRAEVAIEKSQIAGRRSYDYWALKSNGDFFLLQSLFEDARSENQIFFNTRIVRISEALLFCSNLYANLGVSPDAPVSVRIEHRGLAGRVLGSASPNRMLFEKRTAGEGRSRVELVVALGKIRERLVEIVQQVAEPMFMLFDFHSFSPVVYEDIVRRFEKGEAS